MHVRQAALFGILVCPAHEELKDHQADGLAYPEPQRFRRQASVRGLHALFVHDAIEAAERGRVGPLLARQLGLEAALCAAASLRLPLEKTQRERLHLLTTSKGALKQVASMPMLQPSTPSWTVRSTTESGFGTCWSMLYMPAR